MKPIQAFSAAVINRLIFSAFGMKFITDGVQFGADATVGSWKLVKVGTDIIRYRYESGSWVDKGAFLA